LNPKFTDEINPCVYTHIISGDQSALRAWLTAMPCPHTPTDINAASCPNQLINFNAPANVERTGKHNRVRVNMVQFAHLARWTKLLKQPAGITDSTILNQRIKQILVVASISVVLDEPAKSIGAWAPGLDKLSCEIHDSSILTIAVRKTIPIHGWRHGCAISLSPFTSGDEHLVMFAVLG
jgi:hypothetical protein